MDTSCNSEQKTLANEIIQGMELAKQLEFHLSSSTSSPETQEMLLQRILSSYDNALLILNWGGSSVGQPPQPGATATAVPESPISVHGSPQIGDFNTGFKDPQEQDHRLYASKKRKALPTWKDQVRVCAENGIEGSSDDGFSWRKYGKKDILGAKYPRSYYRCTYRNTQTCWATKQVQRSDEDPALFEITYRGRHTCHQASHAVVPPASPEKQEQKHKNHYSNHQQQQPDENLFNLRANLGVKTEDLNKEDMFDPFSFPSAFGCLTSESQLSFSTPVNDNLTGSFPPFISPATSGSPFISPATSGSSYFSVSPYKMNSFGQVSESELSEIISANTITTNSLIVDLDFSIDQVDLDPNFPCNIPGFSS